MPKKAGRTVLPNEWVGRLSPLGGNGGLSAQRPDQGEGRETSTSPEAPVDWGCALRSMSDGTGAAGGSGSFCSRNYGSLSQRRHVPEQKLLSGQPPIGSLIPHLVKPGTSSHPGASNLCHFPGSRYF